MKRLDELNHFKYNGQPVRFQLGTLLFMFFSVILIVMATFTELQFSHFIIPLDLFPKWSFYFTDNGVNWDGFFKSVKYIPQVPVIFFILESQHLVSAWHALHSQQMMADYMTVFRNRMVFFIFLGF